MEEKGINQKTINTNGINIHYAEIGQGPLILFLHGFPESWYTWRHQMVYMASHGYRAVAPDLRGFGATTGVPNDDPAIFTTLHVVGDIVSFLKAVAEDEDKVFVVGHDWGAIIAWALSTYRPDKVKALVNMSVVFTPRNPNRKPLETLRAVCGDDYYICRFQEKGEIEREFAEIGTKTVLKNILTYRKPTPLILPKGKAFPDSPITLPSWLSEEDLDYYTSMYEKSGFTGSLNYYRAIDLNWELTAPWTGAQIRVPVKFIVGDLDITYNAPGTKDYIQKGGMKKFVPFLEDVVVLKDVGHFLHEEKPDEINKFYHAYDNYMMYAFPHDELKPLTKTSTDSLSGLGNLKLEHLPDQYNGSALTLIESLSRFHYILSGHIKMS